MTDFKLYRVCAKNFKSFDRLDIDLSNASFVILGGKNGFGKSTVFDIIELVLTGEIKRYSDYLSKLDRRNKFNKECKPLVFDSSCPEVVLEIFVQIENERLWLMRKAKVEDMTNPVSFTPFSTLYLKRGEKEEYSLTNLDEISPKLKTISNNYNFIHYIDQEEGSIFLKKKTKERYDDMKCLFNTERFDKDIERIEVILEFFRKQKDKTMTVLSQKRKKKDILQENIRKISPEGVPFFSKISDLEIPWDKEEPDLSLDEYFEIIKEDGIIDGIVYFIKHKEDFVNYNIHNKIKENIKSQKDFDDLIVHMYYSLKSYELSVYEFFENVKNIIKTSGLSNLDFSILLDSKLLPSCIDSWRLRELKDNLSYLKELSKNCDSLQLRRTGLLSLQQQIVLELNDNFYLDNKKCPLCGHDYTSHKELLESINEQTRLLKETIDDSALNLKRMQDDFKVKLNSVFLEPMDRQLKVWGLTDSVITVVNDKKLKNFADYLREKFILKGLENLSFEELKNKLYSRMMKVSRGYDKSLNYERMFDSELIFPSIVHSNNIAIKSLEDKKNYLRYKYVERTSKEFSFLQSDISKTEYFLQFCENKINSLHTLLRDLETQRRSYLERLIVDTEILFYIYTGRIMQDCFFGRGVFMKLTNDKRNVLFVSGQYNNDIDVLYNMSSGQLASIVIAFTLALNKLYATCSFLAIDDPVQTMDDMNFWGFIETIRHEFNEWNVLLSSHEADKGGLIRYKAAKLNIPSHYFDMATLRGHISNQ